MAFIPGDVSGGDSSVPNYVATNPSVTNLSMPLADTEYTHTVDAGAKYIRVYARTGSSIRLAFTSGGSYVSLPPGSEWKTPDLTGGAAITFYVSSTKGSEVLEIETWT